MLVPYPCLCLKRGFFLLITYSLPFLRTILQSTLRFLMDALTFIVLVLLPLTDRQLVRLGFEKQTDGASGPVKYMKGAFRLMTPAPDRFDNFEMWYREDRRHITQPIFVHELQNHYRDMTKVELSLA